MNSEDQRLNKASTAVAEEICRAIKLQGDEMNNATTLISNALYLFASAINADQQKAPAIESPQVSPAQPLPME